MREISLAVVQMQMSEHPEENIEKADQLVREAAAGIGPHVMLSGENAGAVRDTDEACQEDEARNAKHRKGADVILLPELFERPYFCQERRYDYYAFASSTEENPAVRHFRKVAKELGIAMPVSFYERDGMQLFNSIAMIDADGTVLGIYRKTHIPDDHFYQEKFYFTPGNTGFRVWDTAFGKIGVGICWDQWFPEAARCMALQGAELLLYPTAIGSEPILETDSMPHWRRCMQGHAGSNLLPVAAANRVGTETVHASRENGGQESALCFYGSSFITDGTGEIVAEADRSTETVLLHRFDLDAVEEDRLSWGIFRDRREEMYGRIVG